MHSQRPVSPRTIYTDKNPIGDTGPAGVLSCAVKANLRDREQEYIQTHEIFIILTKETDHSITGEDYFFKI